MPSSSRQHLHASTLLVLGVIVGPVFSTTSNHFVIEHNETHLSVSLDDIILISHTPSSPFLFVGTGSSISRSRFGNYEISDYVDSRVSLPIFSVQGLKLEEREEGEARERVSFTDGCSNTSKPNEVRGAIRAAIQAGYRHIDGAAAYGNEAEVGAGIKDEIDAGTIKREDLFVTTKLAPVDNRASGVRAACETSLKTLGLDYVDLYLMHWPFAYQTGHGPFPLGPDGCIMADNEVDYLDSWKEMEKLVDDGLVRGIGVCNFNESQLKRLLALPPRIPVCNLQVELTPYKTSNELVELCKANGIILTAYSPLGSPDRPAKQDDDPSLFEDPVVCDIAKAKGVSPAQVLIRFQIDRGIAVIPKSVTPSRIKENAGVLDFQLTAEEVQRLCALNRNFQFIAFVRAKSCKHYPFH